VVSTFSPWIVYWQFVLATSYRSLPMAPRKSKREARFLGRTCKVQGLGNVSASPPLFNQQLERLVAQAGSPETEAELEQALVMDWSGYIAKALRSAGFRDHDIDTMTHDDVIRLLANPGVLVQGLGREAYSAEVQAQRAPRCHQPGAETADPTPPTSGHLHRQRSRHGLARRSRPAAVFEWRERDRGLSPATSTAVW
jgi:hypothetical protein